MKNYSDQELDKVLGTNSQQFVKYKLISIDNGTDIAGTNATGDFIEKKYNQEKKQVERTSFAPSFNGVILSAQAQLVDKAKLPTWKTSEFDMTDKDALITIYPLQGGKFIKDIQTNQVQTKHATYEQIKRSRRIQNPDGSVQNTYNYFVVLYIGIKDEIIKLKFKGTSRGNYFDYSKELSKLGAKIYNISTVFSTYIDKEFGKYSVKFEVEIDAKGDPISVNPEEIRSQRVQVAQGLTAFTSKQLPNSKPTEIEQPETPLTPKAEEEIPTIDDVNNSINIEEVPFD